MVGVMVYGSSGWVMACVMVLGLAASDGLWSTLKSDVLPGLFMARYAYQWKSYGYKEANE